MRHQAAMEERERQHRAEWEAAISEKQRLAVMRADEATFRKSIMDRRAAEFQALAVRPCSFPMPSVSRIGGCSVGS